MPRFPSKTNASYLWDRTLVRQAAGSDIISSYTDDEVRGLVQETMPITFLTALLTTAFLDYPAEHQSAVAMLNEYT
jgi:hypothetical protein